MKGFGLLAWSVAIAGGIASVLSVTTAAVTGAFQLLFFTALFLAGAGYGFQVVKRVKSSQVEAVVQAIQSTASGLRA